MTRQPPTYTDLDLGPSEAEASDAELITAVRGGDESAFAALWSRHEAAAHRLARQISNPSNADDLVSEAFMRVLRALRAGSGPDGAFRPYLFSTLRRINIDNGRSYYTRVALTDDERDLDLDHSESAADVLAENADGSAAWRAWNSLPDSTKTLLWHLIIEEETPAQIAPLIGTSPNGVSSRAVRAKERLRQAFLQQHLLDAQTDGCRQARRRLGEYVRDALSTRDRTEVQHHLDDCAACQRALFEVSDINQTMKVIIGPAVLGGLAIAGNYLAAGSVGAAAHGGIFGSLTKIGQSLKNPAIATATVVAVVAVGIGSAFGITALTSSNNNKPISAAVPPGSGSGGTGNGLGANGSSKIGGAVIPLATPTSATPSSTNPAPTPSTSAIPTSKAPTPTAKKTTPALAKSTGKVAIVPTTVLTTPNTAASSPTGGSSSASSSAPPALCTLCVQATVVTTVDSQQAATQIQFKVFGAGWNIQYVDSTAVPAINCDADGTPSGTTVTCPAEADIPAGEQTYIVHLETTSPTPADGAYVTWVYTDQTSDPSTNPTLSGTPAPTS